MARSGPPPESLTSAWPGIRYPGPNGREADINGTGESWRILSLAVLTAGIGLTMAGCSGGGVTVTGGQMRIICQSEQRQAS
jgi:hypothetical protein